ncbi:MAG: AAA family ATPase [Eubacteriales bacterium]|nr:AAA family ATPase [Eubacteriales bacterium]
MKEKKTFRPIPGLGREEEEKQLAEIICIAQQNLTEAEDSIRQLSEELYDLMETYGPKDKEGLVLLHNTQSQLREHQRDLMRCQKARKKPYFGRIDFKDSNLPYEESYYVGRVGISQKGAEPIVIDWRAPAASVYYENSIGPCRYEVKNEGACEIDLKRKRTYEIVEDKLKDFFDSDVVANDELLTKYLAKSKRAVLGEIIATIQKEQNAIIRKSPKTNLIVQGVAGSGKTTVAMHRISYILYNYQEEFRPENFYIIGSNRILLNYITGVLPDLDVYGVSQMTMEQLFVRLLYEDWNPELHQICPIDKKNKAACIKGSYEWFHDLERFCMEYEKAVIPRTEIRLEKNGVLLMDETMIRNYLEEHPQMSMQGKITMLNEILLSKLENELTGKYVSYTQAEKKELQRKYRRHFGKDVWKGSVFELYQEFLQVQQQKGKGFHCCDVSALEEKDEEAKAARNDGPLPENTFDVYDLAALAYLYKRIKETDGVREAAHVIIDEAQDFGMMAYEALAYCLRGCTYTIMGDVSQNIHFGYGLNDWQELRELILTGMYDSFGVLKKSYRNTVEISDFATEILRHGSFPVYPAEPIIRHRNPVRVTSCRDENAMLLEAVEIIKGWQKEGHETIAVICRDEREASIISKRLSEKLPIEDSNPETAEFGCGIMVLPVEYTKGLEFDAVLLYHPSAENYPAQDQYVKLLYVAATRALHELAVVHQGDLTDLIGKPVSEEKRMQSLENQGTGEVREYVKHEISDKEQKRLDVQHGDKDRALRGYIGPKPITVQPQKKPGISSEVFSGQKNKNMEAPCIHPVSENLLKKKKPVRGAAGKSINSGPVNTSPYQFGACPDPSMLRPAGHGRIDHSIRIVRKKKKYIDLTSRYGTLRLTPLEENIIRVQFRKGGIAEFAPCYWDYEPKSPVSWRAREGKYLVEASTGELTVRIDKRTGALMFLNKKGQRLLAEKEDFPRQIETADSPQTWVYFDWQRNEKLSAKGILAEDLERMNQKARYISFGGKQLRMPLLVSGYGYGIGVAAERTVMCCDISMYGPYLYTDGSEQIDYYFLFGEKYGDILELYKKLQNR